MKKILLLLILFYSCDNHAGKKVNRTEEQSSAVNSDTLLLNFTLYMSEIKYKVNFAKNIVNKKIFLMTDGDYKYALDLGVKKYYASIVPEFLNDSLVNIQLKFSDSIDRELLEIFNSKYGEPDYINKEDYTWRSKSSKKTISLSKTFGSNYIDYGDADKYFYKKYTLPDSIKKQSMEKVKKDF